MQGVLRTKKGVLRADGTVLRAKSFGRLVSALLTSWDSSLLTSSHTCCPGDDGKTRQDSIETAEHHGFEIVSLFTVRFVVALTCSGIVKEPGTQKGEQSNLLGASHGLRAYLARCVHKWASVEPIPRLVSFLGVNRTRPQTALCVREAETCASILQLAVYTFHGQYSGVALTNQLTS